MPLSVFSAGTCILPLVSVCLRGGKQCWQLFNSLALGGYGSNSESMVFKLIMRNDNLCNHSENALK